MSLINRKGFVLVEGLAALSLIGVLVVLALGGISATQWNNVRATNDKKAADLALEGIEAVKNIRDHHFFDLQDGTYGLALVANRWVLATTTETIEGFFTRQIQISTPFTNRKEVDVVISWPGGHQLTASTEFDNWYATVENWSNPLLEGTFDLTPGNSGSNNHKVRSVKESDAYLYVANDNSGGKEFLVFDISKAPNIKIKGTLDLDGNANNISHYGNYVFIASGSQTQELQVIDVSNKSQPQLVASRDLSGQDDGLSSDITANGNYLVLGRQNGNLYVFEISTPTSPSLVGQLYLGISADIKTVKILGNTAFIAVGDGTLRAVNIATPTNPQVISSLTLNFGGKNCSSALSLDATSARAYVGCANFNGFFVVNIENPASMIILSVAAFGSGVASVYHISFAFTNNLIFLMNSNNSAEFAVWNVSNDLAPSLLSSVDLSGTPSQADYSPLLQKMFVGKISDPEIEIITPDLTNQ